jgi:hypothetical protein
MSGLGRSLRTWWLMLASLSLGVSGQAQHASGLKHVGRVTDSSYHHLLAGGGLTAANLKLAQSEPRILFRLAERNLDGGQVRGNSPVLGGDDGDLPEPIVRLPEVDGVPSAATNRKALKFDWSVSLGTGSVAANMFPAKYSFNLSANPDCTNDYVVFALNVAGVTGGQGNLVGINKLYSGSSPTGLCGTTPNVYWAYNGSTAGGSVLTSVQLSTDGTKVAYVESTATSSIFHVLTWKAGEGTSATTSAAPTLPNSCTATSSCLVSVTYSSTSTTTVAPPWVDYPTDKAYVASDDGKVYRLSCAFSCPLNKAPTIDWTFTLPVAGTGGAAPVPSGPVYDFTTKRLIVADSLGELWVLNVAGVPAVFAGPVMIGGGGCTTTNPPGRTGTPAPCTASGKSYGVTESPLVDVTGPKVFAFTGNDGTVGNSATVVQLNENLTGAVRVHVGIGSVANTTTNVDLHDGAFDNTYLNGTPSSGHLFLCGTNTTNTIPYHWWIGFTAYPTMNSTATQGPQRVARAGVPCTPYTEFYNPNLNLGGVAGHHDLLISGLTAAGANGYIITDDISTGVITGGLNFVNYPGGVSAVSVDNVSTQAQASSVYFSTLTNSTVGTCANTHCGVKLTQGGLQ